MECNDPVARCFSLSSQAQGMAHRLPEYREEYNYIAKKCIELPCKLLGLCENMSEVELFLKERSGTHEHILVTEKTKFPRILLAFENNYKAFVAHPYCQQVKRLESRPFIT